MKKKDKQSKGKLHCLLLRLSPHQILLKMNFYKFSANIVSK